MRVEDILALYQYDPQHPPELVESFDAELNWFGTKRRAVIGRFIVRPDFCEYYTFWRFDDDDGAWCLLEAMGSLRLEKIWDEDEAAPEKLIHRIRSSMGKGAFCRLFFLPEIRKYVGVTSGAGTFYDWVDSPSKSFHFHQNKLKRQLCSETKQLFDSVLANEKSDAAFAYRLLKRGSATQALIFNFANVEAYERASKITERLITLVLWPVDISWIPDEHHFVQVPISERPFPIMNSSYFPVAGQFTRQEQQWIDLIKRFGPLQISEEHRKKHRAVEYSMTLLSFHLWPPTAHESIEARHEFLEWAKTTLPAAIYAEVAAMEGQL